jgi:hypothetical protein
MCVRIPLPRSSLARVSASASIADFAIEYGAPLAANLRVATLDTITMSPRPSVRIWGISSWHR